MDRDADDQPGLWSWAPMNRGPPDPWNPGPFVPGFGGANAPQLHGSQGQWVRVPQVPRFSRIEELRIPGSLSHKAMGTFDPMDIGT